MACHIIPEEVLVSEIFMKLRASCVVTLRSVCRSWHRLTREPSFVCAHIPNGRADAISQLDRRTTKDGELRMLKLDADNDISTFNIRTVPGSSPILCLKASCDGLLCFQRDDEEESKPYLVCNPVTRIWTTVPTSARDRLLCGFYFHRLTGEYRLLHCSLNKVTDQTPLSLEGSYEVATVGGEDKSWRSICKFSVTEEYRVFGTSEDYDGAEVLALFAFRKHSRSVAVNGRLYWLEDEMGVVVFDTESEKFSRISVPVGPLPNCFIPHKLQMSKILGNLCLVRTRGKRYDKMELWMLKDQRQWVELYTIVHDQGGRELELIVHDDGKEGDGELLVRWGMNCFGLYDFKLKTYKRMTITPTTDIYAHIDGCDLLHYTESLVDPRTNLP